jgi:microcystin-dependent protein
MMLGEIRREHRIGDLEGLAECRGQLMAISQNTALFEILGNQYGGDGKSTFALPTLTPTDSGPPFYIALVGVFPQWD